MVGEREENVQLRKVFARHGRHGDQDGRAEQAAQCPTLNPDKTRGCPSASVQLRKLSAATGGQAEQAPDVE